MIKNELPHDGEIDKNTSDEPDHEDGDCRPQHLRPVPSEGHFLGLGLGGHPDGKQGDEEGGKVREEVRSVGGDGQGVAQHPTHDLGDHEEDTEDSCCHKLTACSVLERSGEARVNVR